MIHKSHFRFNKQERSGIFFLLLILVAFQVGYYYLKAKPYSGPTHFALNEVEQAQLDSLRTELVNEEGEIFPFNPNYISDYKGYTLGISPEALDRLHEFRDDGKFVNSAKEFQQVTQISDSLLRAISPSFKFPTWKNNSRSSETKNIPSKSPVVVKDLNKATAEELETVYGIGATLSKRIIKFRDRLGGFLINEQLFDVYGLKPEVAQKVLLRFQVVEIPVVEKININKASVDELARLVYINYDLAKEIIQYREQNNGFSSLDELTNLTSLPKDRIGRIKLYLSL